ncbi:hypothetical protein EDD36DRAFT_327560 [Exophiala viscosa]|uniref:Mid2 domain-containing protein n=1 Tax=Exophiala viscosa TaxID=2486360 RepID=A0AAN6IAS0_9EURO|nr:hypothetical protein EDD36DRAFT_327560 [Exophiala viscosa]
MRSTSQASLSTIIWCCADARRHRKLSSRMNSSVHAGNRSSLTTTITAADQPQAVLLYPTGQPTINNIDDVQVTYDTVWENANLTLFCGINENRNEWTVAKIRLFEPSGAIAIAPIHAGMAISHFPVSCNMLLYDASNRSDFKTGGAFTMISTQGVVSTFAMTISTAITPLTTKAQSEPTSESLGAADKSSLSTSLSATTSATTAMVASTAGRTSASSAASATSGLSGGARAGIAVGAIIGVFAMIATTFFLFRLKHRTNRAGTMVHAGMTASAVTGPSSKKVITPILVTTTRLRSPSAGGRVTVFKIGQHNRRHSEDWRRFFGNGNISTATKPVPA